MRRIGSKMVTQAIPLYPPVAALGSGAADFEEKLTVGKFWQILAEFADFHGFSEKLALFVIMSGQTSDVLLTLFITFNIYVRNVL